jgi:hypothetical protein
MKVKVVDIDLARDRFNYDPETGEITWKNSLRWGNKRSQLQYAGGSRAGENKNEDGEAHQHSKIY